MSEQIIEQVHAFFRERNLVPVVHRDPTNRPTRVHASLPVDELQPLCRPRSATRVARPPELNLPPCRACTNQHVWLRQRVRLIELLLSTLVYLDRTEVHLDRTEDTT